jgi:hypothetical protein
MEEDDVYYIDTRNAPVVVSRTNGGRATVRPGTRVVGPHAMGSPYAVNRAAYYQNPYMAASPFAAGALGAGLGANLFGGMTGGQLVELIAQIFAAVMPLPAAPVATTDAATDVGNLILFQSSLAQYAKRDEQVRTLGNLVTKLLG